MLPRPYRRLIRIRLARWQRVRSGSDIRRAPGIAGQASCYVVYHIDDLELEFKPETYQ